MKYTAILYDKFSRQWLGFSNPVFLSSSHTHEEVNNQLESLENLRKKGFYVVFLLSYEAAPIFDSALTVRKAESFPLCWMGVFNKPEDVDPDSLNKGKYKTGNWKPSINKSRYEGDIRKIKNYIKEGYTYQVNYSYRTYADFEGNPFAYFLDIYSNQKTDYAAYIDIGDFVICSVSPELLFRLDGDSLLSKPMKGTIHRGRYLEEDEANSRRLFNSKKNRAENVMIVDMIRNDLGRVSEYNSVRVNSLYDIEKYPTALQMTSTVSSTTRAGLKDILSALFPCSSITGAPKPRTMKIIAELETTPRNIYTGSIGLIKPGDQAVFNVAIRTVLLNREKSRIEYGTGGGIVWESEIEEEYDESQTKARILGTKKRNFGLLETMLWTKDEGFFLLEYHLKRMSDSAKYFDFKMEKEKIKKMLREESRNFSQESYKIRLTLSEHGAIEIKCSPFIIKHSNPLRLNFAEISVDSKNPMLYHKTTDRAVYELALKGVKNCDDVILLNEKGEVTETSIYNIVIKVKQEFFTPKFDSGLLRGTFRTYLIEKEKIKERIITKNDLYSCDQIFVVNSVRKWQEAVLIDV